MVFSWVIYFFPAAELCNPYLNRLLNTPVSSTRHSLNTSYAVVAATPLRSCFYPLRRSCFQRTTVPEKTDCNVQLSQFTD